MGICSIIKGDIVVRTKKCRVVSSLPNVTYFKPAGIPLRFLSEIRLSVEEAEALRLKDVEALQQTEAASKMGVSRPTFQRVLSAARQKVADALLNGKAIRIEGGSFQVVNTSPDCLANQRQETDGSGERRAKCPYCSKAKSKDVTTGDTPGVRRNQDTA